MLLEEHVVRRLDEVVDVELESVEEARLEAHVEGARALPLQGTVALGVEGERGRAIEVVYFVEVVVEVVVRSGTTIGEVQGLVPQDTIAGLELEVVDPLDRGEELFLADDPSSTYRAEGTPAESGAKREEPSRRTEVLR